MIDDEERREIQSQRRRLIVTAIRLGDAEILARLLRHHRLTDPAGWTNARDVCELAAREVNQLVLDSIEPMLREVDEWNRNA